MNLHGIVAGAIGTVNPQVPVDLSKSAGYTTAADGTQVPTYAALATGVMAQVQPLSARELRHVDGLNIQGEFKSIYLYGKWGGIIRATQQGGDLITLPDGSRWLMVDSLEDWPDWCKVVACRQL